MASKKDMRRNDLIVPYMPPEEKKEDQFGSTMSSTLPMAAIFTRNKLIGWTSVIFAVQSWLSESPNSASTTPGYFSVGMALMALGVTYLPLFLPPQAGQVAGTGTEAPGPVPLS